jgi:hypothetical protein
MLDTGVMMYREEKAARFRKEQDEKDAAKQAKAKVKAEEEAAAAKQAEAQRWLVVLQYLSDWNLHVFKC